MDVAAAGVRARLEHCPHSALGIAEANSVDRLTHGGWVMREIVDDENAVRLSARFLPALDAAKRCEAGGNFFARYLQGARRRVDADGILDVVAPRHRPKEARCRTV